MSKLEKIYQVRGEPQKIADTFTKFIKCIAADDLHIGIYDDKVQFAVEKKLYKEDVEFLTELLERTKGRL